MRLQVPGSHEDLNITGFGHSEMDEYALQKQPLNKQRALDYSYPDAGKRIFSCRSDSFLILPKFAFPLYMRAEVMKILNTGVDLCKKDEGRLYEKNKYPPACGLNNISGRNRLSGIQFWCAATFHVAAIGLNETKFPKCYLWLELSLKGR